MFTITLLRDYSACGFLARPICFRSAAGGSLPSPKLHAGLYKRPRCLGGREAPVQPGSAEVLGSFGKLQLFFFFPTLSSSQPAANPFNPRLTRPRFTLPGQQLD